MKSSIERNVLTELPLVGEDVPLNRLIHEIFATSEGIENVVLTSPAADVIMSSRELPSLGTVSITVVAS